MDGKVTDFNDRSVGQHHGALNYVFQLANVSGPGIFLDRLYRQTRKAVSLLGEIPAEAFEKVLSEHGTFSSPIAQWRETKLYDIQTVIEILAELTPLHHLLQ